MANIATTNITKGQSSVTASSFSTASITPTANRVCLLAVWSSGSSTRNTPTVTGASATWTQVATVDINAIGRCTIFRTFNTSPGTGALTIDFGGQSQDRCVWILDDFTSTRITGINGANAIVQSASNTGSSSTGVTATLAAFANSANSTYGATMNQTAGLGATITPGSGFTKTAEQLSSDSFLDGETEFKVANDTTVDFTVSTTAPHVGVIGLELANLSTEPTGGAFLFNFI